MSEYFKMRPPEEELHKGVCNSCGEERTLCQHDACEKCWCKNYCWLD